jgi:hypothetical protein
MKGKIITHHHGEQLKERLLAGKLQYILLIP